MLKFNVESDRPTAYNLTFVGFIAMFAIAVMFRARATPMVLSLAFVVSALALLVLLGFGFVRQARYNFYSYDTIYYIGFSLFALTLLALLSALTVEICRNPDLYKRGEILHVLLDSGMGFIVVSFPAVVAFAAWLCVSNVVLIRREGKRFHNYLGILLSVAMVLGAVLVYLFNFRVSRAGRREMLHDLIGGVASTAFLYVECMLIGTVAASFIAARHEPPPDRDFVMILGCKVAQNGEPTPLLRGRIDRALAFAEKQMRLTGRPLRFIASGGKGSDECVSECACIKRYLVSKGVDEAMIVEEDKSENTYQNFEFSYPKIRAIDPNANIAFATTNYHVFRSGLYAHKLNMRAVGMGAGTKWYYWPNAGVREFIGLLIRHRAYQAMILTGMIVAYVALTLIYYL